MALKLSLSIISRVEINQVLRELNTLDDFFIGADARAGHEAGPPPRVTRVLNQLARENRVNLLDTKQRKDLEDQLKSILKDAPTLHISFAAEPSPQALEKILMWMRENIHPQVLLQVGLQPAIAAGCILRTPNQLFDMSMRAYLDKQRPYLLKLVEGAAREQ